MTAEDVKIPWLERFAAFSGPMLFIYGGADPTAKACIEFYRHLCRLNRRHFDLHTIQGSNHAFYGLSWRRQLIDVTAGWICRHLAGCADEPAGG